MKLQRTLEILVTAGLLITTSGSAWAQADDVHASREVYRRAYAAYQDKDFASYLNLMIQMNELRPGHPEIVYNIACAHALNGQEGDALKWLDRFARMGMVANISEDEDLGGLERDEAFQEIVEQIERNSQPIGMSEIAFTLAERDLLTEGVAHDSETGAFFVTSVRARKIVKCERDGSPSDFIESGGDGIWSVFALAADPERRHLWACAAAMAQTPGVDSTEVGRSGLFLYNLDNANLIRKVLLPPDSLNHILNDLCQDQAGNLYVTDNQIGTVYRLPVDGDRLEVLVPSGRLVSPQGIALSPDEKTLYVADYSTGIYRVDPVTGETVLLESTPNSTLLGIDGLQSHGTDLIAIQNGVRPNRIIRVTLKSDQESIEAVEVIEANHPLIEEPVVGNKLYYVANSQWGQLAEDGSIRDPESLLDPVILMLPLD